MIDSPMTLKIKLLLSLIFISSHAFSQTDLDSLKRAAASSQRDTNTVIACNTLAEELTGIDNELALSLTQKAFEISKGIDFKDGITWSLANSGFIYDQMDMVDSAVAHFERAKYYKGEFGDVVGMGKMDLNIGSTYLTRGYYRPSAEAFYKAEAYFSSKNNKILLSKVYNNLGIVFRSMKNFKTSEEYYKKSMSIKQELKDTQGIAAAYINISALLVHQKKYEAAEKMGLEGYEHCLKANLMPDAASCLINVCTAYLETGRPDDAKSYLEIIHKTYLEEQETYMMADYYALLSEYEFKKGNSVQAYQSAKKAIELGESFGRLEFLTIMYNRLSGIAEGLQKNSEALAYLRQALSFNDSLFMRENQRQVNEMEVLYKTREKEEENKNLKTEKKIEYLRAESSVRQRNLLLIFLFIFSLLGVLIIWLYVQKNKAYTELTENKKALEVAVDQKDTLLRELHHRVKNNLQVVTGLLDLQMARISDPDVVKALNDGKNRIRSMALIHQKLYRTDDLKSVDMKEYIENLLQELTRGFVHPDKTIKTIVSVQQVALDVDKAIPLGLIINELVTNSFKYAFNTISEGIIEINLRKEGEAYILNVKDNGPGFEGPSSGSKTSLGLRLVNMLVKQIGGTVEFTNFSGTEIIIKF